MAAVPPELADLARVADGDENPARVLHRIVPGRVALDDADLYRQHEHRHRTLTTRSVIERAKGLLMSGQGVSSEDTFLLLQQESQRSHRKVREVAQALLDQHQPGGAGPDAPWTPPRRTGKFPGEEDSAAS